MYDMMCGMGMAIGLRRWFAAGWEGGTVFVSGIGCRLMVTRGQLCHAWCSGRQAISTPNERPNDNNVTTA